MMPLSPLDVISGGANAPDLLEFHHLAIIVAYDEDDRNLSIDPGVIFI
jgi:hypothetical protein